MLSRLEKHDIAIISTGITFGLFFTFAWIFYYHMWGIQGPFYELTNGGRNDGGLLFLITFSTFYALATVGFAIYYFILSLQSKKFYTDVFPWIIAIGVVIWLVLHN